MFKDDKFVVWRHDPHELMKYKDPEYLKSPNQSVQITCDGVSERKILFLATLVDKAGQAVNTL